MVTIMRWSYRIRGNFRGMKISQKLEKGHFHNFKFMKPEMMFLDNYIIKLSEQHVHDYTFASLFPVAKFTKFPCLESFPIYDINEVMKSIPILF